MYRPPNIGEEQFIDELAYWELLSVDRRDLIAGRTRSTGSKNATMNVLNENDDTTASPRHHHNCSYDSVGEL